MQITQTCRRCGQEKGQGDYHPGKWGQPGTYCRKCCADYKTQVRRAAGARPRVRRLCGHEGCDRRPSSKKARYCGPEHRPQPVLSTDYRAVHARIQRIKGPARQHHCACGAQAEEWAYDHADPSPLRGTTPRGIPAEYSADPSHYRPMCRSCHARFDAAK